MNVKMSFFTHCLQSFVGRRVEIQDTSDLDGTRGILKSYVLERNTIVGVIQVRTLMDRLFNREGEFIIAPIESLIDLVTSTPLDIYSTDMVETECEVDEDGEDVDVNASKYPQRSEIELDMWKNIRRDYPMSEELKEQMYQEFYESCPCTHCNHSGSIDTLGDESPCLSCSVADNCGDIDSNCAECKYRDLVEED